MLLLDVHMPVMGGLETLEVVRRSGPHRSLPVVMMTVDRDESVVKRAVALGISDFLVKPFTPHGVKRLEHVLRSLRAECPDRGAMNLAPIPVDQRQPPGRARTI